MSAAALDAELARLRAQVELYRAAFLPRSDERDRWRARCVAEWRSGYQAGFTTGQEIGRRQAIEEEARAWREMARPVARGGPPFAEVEVRRWGPGGRARFGDPRPGDYMGGPVEWGVS